MRKEPVRINRRGVNPHLVMQVRTGGSACHSDVAQRFALANFFAFHYIQFRQVTVPCLVAIAVIDNDTTSVPPVPTSGDDYAISRGLHRRAHGRADIYACMPRAFTRERIGALAKTAHQTPHYRPDSGKNIYIRAGENGTATACEIRGLKIVVFLESIVHGGNQRSFADQIGRTGDLVANPVSRRDFFGEDRKAGKLLIGLLNLFLQGIVTMPQQFSLALERIVIGNFEGHSGIASGHAEQAQHDKAENSERAVKKSMRHVDATKTSVEGMRQNNYEIILLQIPSP